MSASNADAIQSHSAECGLIIKKWRKKRRYSQLKLSLEVGLSSKHLSFIETGRSKPSKSMIFRLNQHLEMPRPELNSALRSAGHLPVFQHLTDDDKNLEPVHYAINRIIEQQMPYPAFVLDRYWNVVAANTAMKNLLDDIDILHHKNIIEALTDPEFKRGSIANYDEVMYLLYHRFKSELSHTVYDQTYKNLEEKLNNVITSIDETWTDSLVLNTHFSIHGKDIQLFSVIVDMGSVQDVTVGCFKIELMFPSNKETENYFNHDNPLPRAACH